MNHQKNSLAMIFSFRIIIVVLSISPFSKYLATANNNGLELNSQLKFWEYVKEYSNRGNQNLYPRYGSTKQGKVNYNISNRSLTEHTIFEKQRNKNGMLIYIFKCCCPSQWKLGTVESLVQMFRNMWRWKTHSNKTL